MAKVCDGCKSQTRCSNGFLIQKGPDGEVSIDTDHFPIHRLGWKSFGLEINEIGTDLDLCEKCVIPYLADLLNLDIRKE